MHVLDSSIDATVNAIRNLAPGNVISLRNSTWRKLVSKVSGFADEADLHMSAKLFCTHISTKWKINIVFHSDHVVFRNILNKFKMNVEIIGKKGVLFKEAVANLTSNGFTVNAHTAPLADACVIVLPAKKKSYALAGYYAGRGKKVIIFGIPDFDEEALGMKWVSTIENIVVCLKE